MLSYKGSKSANIPQKYSFLNAVRFAIDNTIDWSHDSEADLGLLQHPRWSAL